MSIGRHTLANVAGAVIPLIIMFATVPIYIRLIGTERYGTLAVIWTLLGYFGFFDLGLGRATAQRMARLRDETRCERSSLLWTALIITAALGVLGGIVLWLSAEMMLTRLLTMTDNNRAEALKAIPWLLIAMPILLTTSTMHGALQGRERFVIINTVGVVANSANQLVPLLIAYVGFIGLDALVPAALSGRLLSGLFLFVYCRKHVPLKGVPVFSRRFVEPLLSYGGWMSFISMLAPVLVTVDRIMIGAISGAKSVAFYTVPYGLVSTFTIVSGSLASALFPRLAAASPDEAAALATRATRNIAAVTTPLVIAAIVCAHPFLDLWMGPEFVQYAAGVSEILLLGVWVNSLVIPHHSLLQAQANLRTLAGIYLFEIPIYLLMLWVGLKYYGIVGAAIAWALRVTLDAALLLRASGVLKQSISENLISFGLVLFAAVAVLAIGSDSTWRLVAMIFLVASSVIHRWKIISSSWNSLPLFKAVL